MPVSVENLLKWTGDQLAASNERCIASDKLIFQTTKIVAITHESIFRSRRQIACVHERQAAEDCPPPLPGPRNQ